MEFFETIEELDFTNVPVKDFRCSVCERSQISDFIEKWHYSHNVNGLAHQYCFKIDYNNELVGAMIYGPISMANVYQSYVENKNDLIELKRLCCIDRTPKNIESYFIGYTLRWLKKNTDIKMVISYSDLEYDHHGTIYKASNFKYRGKTNPGKVIYYKGKRYHDKTIRTKYKDGLKPFAEEIKKALETGRAYYKDTKEKNIWIYDFFN